MNRFSPGPWVANARLSASENHKGYALLSPGFYCIGDLYPIDEDGVEGGANARLIAAAPELLAALDGLLSVYAQPDRRMCCDGRECGCMGASVYQEAEHYAREAIAKATGEGA